MTKTSAPIAVSLMAVLLAALFALPGCSSVYMKGTPLYTGEYSKPQGPPEDRVNLWPLAYYHDPALSLLWPLGSFTDDHFAIRPVFSIYGLDQPRHVYNFVWPIAQVNRDSGHNRVAPVFWWGAPKDSTGKYFVMFPILWCFGEQGGSIFESTTVFPVFWYDKDEYTALFPLFITSAEPNGASTHLLWPVFNVKTGDTSHGWRVWPLYGQCAKQDRSSSYQFALWPLGNRWREGDKAFDSAFPFYVGWRDGNVGWDLALPFYFGQHKPGSNMFITPLICKGSSGKSSFIALPPLLSWVAIERGALTADDMKPTVATIPFRGKRDTCLLGGLIHFGRSADGVTPERRTSHFIPFYYRNSANGLFLSLPYSQSIEGDNGIVSAAGPLYMHGWSGADSWRFVFPLLYERKAGDEKTFVTPLIARHQSGETKSWIVGPLASWLTSSGAERDLWMFGPLAHARWGGLDGSSHVFPLYYYSGGVRTLVTPLCWYSGWGGEKPLFISPLYMSSGNSSDGWNLVPPVLFWQRNASGSLFISPLYARSRTAEHKTNVFPPLLSWVQSDEGRRDWWLLGGLAHARSDAQQGAESYVAPLYYYNAASGTFLTPLFGWTGAGLNSSGATYIGGPLYVHTRNDAGEGRWYLPFPFISGSSTETKKSYWFWPLGSYNRDDVEDKTHGYAAWPLFWYSYGQKERNTGLFPVFFAGYDRREYVPPEKPEVWRTVEQRRFLSLPIFWRRKDVTLDRPKGNATAPSVVADEELNTGCFPLWYYDKKESPDRRDSDFSILYRLYDRRSRKTVASEHEEDAPEETAQTTQGTGAEDYVRARILWRVMHYEKLNNQSSLDVFPFITYDAKKDTRFRKFSFLWRFFRYERTEGGGLKLDVLFVPLSRH